MSRRRLAVWCLLGAVLAAGARPLDATERSFDFDSPEAHGMGGTRVAGAWAPDAALVNPAFAAEPGPAYFLTRWSAAMNADALALFTGTGSDVKTTAQAGNLGAAPAGLLARLADFGARYSMTGPLYLAYKGEGFALAVVDSVRGSFVSTGAALPTVTARLDADLGVVAALGLRLPLPQEATNSLHVGVNLKYVSRVRFDRVGVGLLEAGGLTDPFAMSSDYLVGQAVGSDLGVVYRTPDLVIGAVWRDWFGMSFTWKRYSSTGVKYVDAPMESRVAPRIDIGCAWTPGAVGGLSPEILGGLRVALDIVDFLVEENSFFHMIRVGAEALAFNTVTVRLGLNRGYLSFGLAVSVTDSLAVSWSFSGDEAGLMPGQLPVWSQMLAVTLRL